MAKPSERYIDFEGKDIRARVIKSFLVYSEKNYPGIDIKALCLSEGVSPDRIFVKDDWLTAEEAFGILKKLIHLTGDPLLSFKAGQYGVSEDYLGKTVALTLRYLLSVTAIYRNLSSIIRQFNRTLELSVEKPQFWKRELIFKARLNRQAAESNKNQLLGENFNEVIINLLGYLTSVPKLKGLPEAKVNVVKISKGSVQDIEYVISVKYLDLGAVGRMASMVLVFLLPLGAYFLGAGPILQFLKNITEIQFLTGALAVLGPAVLWLAASNRRAHKIIEQGGLFADENADKNESFDKIVSLFTRAIPKKLLSLAGVNNLRQVEAGQARECNLTVVVVDLKNFSSISEKLGPKDTFKWLNKFYAQANFIVGEFSGIVDKFIGDSLLCYFPENPENAVRAILKLRESLNILNGELPVEHHFHIRCGLHHGPVLVGLLGDVSYFEVTGIGTTVNAATRLEGLNKRLGSEILLSHDVMAQMDPKFLTQFKSHLRYLGHQDLRGINAKFNVFALAPENPLENEALQKFELAVRKFEAGESFEAEQILEKLLTLFKNDPIIQRCLHISREGLDRRKPKKKSA